MTGMRTFGPLLPPALLLLGAGVPATGAPADQLVVEQLPDPDPGYVPPPAERKGAAHTKRDSEDAPTLDQAFENLGRVTGRLAQMGAQYHPSEEELRAARERLRAHLEEQTAGNPRH